MSLYLTEAENKACRDPEIVAAIAVADTKEVQFRPHVIGLDQPDRELAAESFYVDSAAEREREAGVSDVTGDPVGIQLDARHPEQGVCERLNPLVLSQRELRSEQKQGLVLIDANAASGYIAEMAADVGFDRDRFFEDVDGARYVITVQISIQAANSNVFEAQV